MFGDLRAGGGIFFIGKGGAFSGTALNQNGNAGLYEFAGGFGDDGNARFTRAAFTWYAQVHTVRSVPP